MKPFANPDVLVKSWYVLARSKDLKRGRPLSADLRGRRIVVWRDAGGTVHAMNGRCVHLGADLGQGRVTDDDQIECAFHKWRFGTDGVCQFATGLATPPNRKLTVYPAQERWGLVWVFAGPEATFDLPDIPDNFRSIRVPAQHIGCHPHLVLGNVFDVEHFDALHGVKFTRPPKIERIDERTLGATAAGRFESRLTRLLTGTRRSGIDVRFTMTGGSITWAHLVKPFAFHVIFTGRPSESGGCDTSTVFLVPPSPIKALRAILLVMALLHDDSRILDRLQFAPAFTEADAGMAELADLIDEMPTAW